MSVAAVQAALDAAATAYGDALGADGPALLRERAEILGITPQGQVSAGGTCRLLRAGDGRWVAMNLARRDDVDLLAAWMGHEWDGPVWDAVESALQDRDADDAVDRAQLLGIPAAVAVAPADVPIRPVSESVGGTSYPPRSPERGVGGARGGSGGSGGGGGRGGGVVVDLSALWAGPLCARLIGDATGLPVVKVESPARPDGARAGPPEFFERLNGSKEHRVMDLRGDELGVLLRRATIVVTNARPRALEQLGIDPRAHAERGVIWISITGYGYTGPWHDRVAFGDDAAVAGGVAVAAGGADAPVFVGDAVADPLAGLYGAARVAALHRDGLAAFVDVSMRDVVATALTAPQYASSHDQEVA